MDKSELLYKIGITLIPGVGDINAKKIIAYCGGAEAVFTEKKIEFIKNTRGWNVFSGIYR